MQLHLGKKIREHAKLKGIKHTELAQRINTSKQNIQNIYRRESIDVLLLVKFVMYWNIIFLKIICCN